MLEAVVIHYLFVWGTITAGSSGRSYEGWRNLGEFDDRPACVEAVRQLDIPAKDWRCTPRRTLVSPPGKKTQ